jgi:enoyl-CoA hydratase
MPEVETFCEQICANSSFSHAANKRLLEATDGNSMDGGLQWEVFMSEGRGPDMEERIGAFTKK